MISIFLKLVTEAFYEHWAMDLEEKYAMNLMVETSLIDNYP